ncbi:MAG: META domain-containing protein [Proteobacteria bacterium]|nr:META domain-containing protein [Pseudomonadota bacterium]
MKTSSYILLASVLAVAACGKNGAAVSLRGYECSTNVNGTTITLNFAADADRVSGKVVNTYNGPYEINGKNIKFGVMASTMKMGINANAMQVEYNYFKFLPTVNTFQLSSNGVLLLISADGKGLRFYCAKPSAPAK